MTWWSRLLDWSTAYLLCLPAGLVLALGLVLVLGLHPATAPWVRAAGERLIGGPLLWLGGGLLALAALAGSLLALDRLLGGGRSPDTDTDTDSGPLPDSGPARAELEREAEARRAHIDSVDEVELDRLVREAMREDDGA